VYESNSCTELTCFLIDCCATSASFCVSFVLRLCSCYDKQTQHTMSKDDQRYNEIARVIREHGTPNPQFPKDIDIEYSGTDIASVFICLTYQSNFVSLTV